jgi:ATP-dependent Clp protease ATP-binding subunit ClpC
MIPRSLPEVPVREPVAEETPAPGAPADAVETPARRRVAKEYKPAAAAPQKRKTPKVHKGDGSRFKLDPRRFPTLNAIGRNLTLEADLGRLDPVIGRDIEVEQALDVLAKRHGNNPCLVGLAGVGKTRIARALAQRIVRTECPSPMDDRIVVEIPVGELIAGTGVRGALAQRIGALRKEVAHSKGRVVLFFDEIHLLFLADGAEELSSEFKLSLARGELPCIGATTHDEYRVAIDADPALARRFSPIEVVELGREDAFLVLDALAPSFAAHDRRDQGVRGRRLRDRRLLSRGRQVPPRARPAVHPLRGAHARRAGDMSARRRAR